MSGKFLQNYEKVGNQHFTLLLFSSWVVEKSTRYLVFSTSEIKKTTSEVGLYVFFWGNKSYFLEINRTFVPIKNQGSIL